MLFAAVLASAALGVQAQSADAAGAAAVKPFRFGFQFGTVQDHNNTEPVVQLSLGYDFDRTWSVEALGTVSLLFMRMGAMQAGDREFDSAVGARALATLPLAEHWNMVGGLGVVQFRDEVGDGLHNITNSKTSPMVSLAMMYKKSRHWSFGVELSSYTSVHSFNAGLRSEVHF
jgi:hypothetical protein